MNNFTIKETPIKDLVIIEPKVFGDERGFFMETYNQKSFEELGLTMNFVQDNHSKSKKGVLRGLHFQTKHTQGKLIHVIKGSVYDVAVDLRKDSTTFGKWYSVKLSAKNKLMLYVPEGFAHGFLTLEDETEFVYKCTDLYAPEYDSGLLWSDKTLNIDWKFEEFGINPNELTISEKDKVQQKFDKNKNYFE
ncbi:MAG: dTDP-4-dehydrorhamnose 3,5-epimerase [Leptotrichia hongkongensis]|nr:dTDP-4-dehydrorhamnose 3,5-epimerase [Leptotrichia hongkongensis]